MSKWTASDLPIVAAPMAGGATTPALVAGAAAAGAFGFLAGGYKTPEALAAEAEQLRQLDVAFGINLFVPTAVPIIEPDFRRYAAELAAEGEPYGLDLAAAPLVEDDDHWQAKIDLLLQNPPPVVSFTFGLPERAAVTALQRAGSQVFITVTTPAEAQAARDLGADGLIAQSTEAGGHSGTHTPEVPVPAVPLGDLVRQVAALDVPVIAAGGIGHSHQIPPLLEAGAAAVMVGTVLLRTPESGASETHKQALASAGPARTVITHAFTGRPARALTNDFITRHATTAPLGYPAIHHLTRPLRAAAAAAGDSTRLHLWSGTAYQQAQRTPAHAVLTALASDL
ncbi:nitronate monooxygenase [Kribbella sancticallisti]|uniref:Propionate 3-nitronate monooxygenase n=1 Tax=Kribbella sancticallisti TaxID=460087 RepID=A0ABP4PW30_9ACTN